ncbi:MAG: aminotransferase class I/II-fold pyridoxal phosphate-dependent enzyme [Isosphaerales bacterium]
MASPMEKLEDALRQNTLVRIIERFSAEHSETHLKDLVIDEVGLGREIVVLGRRVVNFGSDSFLGFDRDPRVQEAVRRGLERWGTHNGSSRAFLSVRANIEAERKLADWLGVESVLIHPSVMLVNLGAIPGLTGRQDAIALDEQAHSSMQEAAKIARANGTKVAVFAHSDPRSLEQTLEGLRPYRCALVCIDGVYSMSGKVPPMAELNQVARARDAVLYIDDAHGTGVLGDQGKGTVLEALGSYDNTFVVGSLSKAFSCAGGFIGCPEPFHRLLKIRSSPYVFGGPVVPCFLEAIGTVIDILRSHEYQTLRARLDASIGRLTRGLGNLGLIVMGGATPIVSVLIGDEAETLSAGKFLFDRGYYVQSVLFPAVPFHAGVLRVQCNANHDDASIDGLIDAFGALADAMSLPGRDDLSTVAAPRGDCVRSGDLSKSEGRA